MRLFGSPIIGDILFAFAGGLAAAAAEANETRLRSACVGA